MEYGSESAKLGILPFHGEAFSYLVLFLFFFLNKALGFFELINLFINLFIFGCVGSSLLHAGFL